MASGSFCTSPRDLMISQCNRRRRRAIPHSRKTLHSLQIPRGNRKRTKMNPRILTLGLLALTTTAALVSAAGKTAPQHPGLQGTWTLNEDLTARLRASDPQPVLREGGGGDLGGYGGGFP